MICLKIVLDGDNAWPELKGKEEAGQLIEVNAPLQVAVLDGGMSSGAPSVTFRLDLPDGNTVICQTSLSLFLTAADAFKARYGDPRQMPAAGPRN